jgi:hypothetical protein
LHSTIPPLFQVGDLSDIPVPGYQTRFAKILLYSNLSQSQFDTVKTMPDSDTSLTENDFTLDNTRIQISSAVKTGLWILFKGQI